MSSRNEKLKELKKELRRAIREEWDEPEVCNLEYEINELENSPPVPEHEPYYKQDG